MNDELCGKGDAMQAENIDIIAVAVALSNDLDATEQAFFVAGFQEAIKYMQNLGLANAFSLIERDQNKLR